ncbi:MAG: rhodanese-like domain-containing protein [Planctomycetota bacterium]
MRGGEAVLDERGLPVGYPWRSDWEVTPRGVRAMREAGEEFLLLDVREPGEVAAAAVDGVEALPMGQVASRVDELRAWADRPVVVMCHHGVRSLRVAAFLRRAGFADVRSMAGGIELWSRDIDASVPRY